MLNHYVKRKISILWIQPGVTLMLMSLLAPPLPPAGDKLVYHFVQDKSHIDGPIQEVSKATKEILQEP